MRTLDLHPDAYYKIHASTEEEKACHRGKGTAGHYGAETSDCDTPHALINATFNWIRENLKEEVDFVVWTGDSARHDSDEEIPRSAKEVIESNRWITEKLVETFSQDESKKKLEIPVVGTFGNNDILPHNILTSGPNKWLKEYTDIWSKFIPEEQRHGFEKGGWYYVEVIPGKLAVFSLNTLYFFDNNAAVDGCALKSEPGFAHMEWLRIQLQFVRERGMKAILMGHVPPARTDSKQLWDETCWQKYTLWLKQYRDVVVGGLYGHMNIDHFVLQDSKDVDIVALSELTTNSNNVRVAMDEELTILSASDYLGELRKDWKDLPDPNILDVGEENDTDGSSGGKKRKNKKSKKDKKREKAEKKLGGPWGERFQVTHISPSIVPNYFPTLRVLEYNITGLDRSHVWSNPNSWFKGELSMDAEVTAAGERQVTFNLKEQTLVEGDDILFDETSGKKKKSKKDKKKKKKKPTDPNLIVPEPPAKTAPPGPAYSPQTLTLLGYTQYFANLTHINNDFVKPTGFNAEKWREGKHKGKNPADDAPSPKPFEYRVEYDTFTDPVYKLKDMTVKSYIKLAHRIGQYKPVKGHSIDALEEVEDSEEMADDWELDSTGKKDKKDKKKKEKKQRKTQEKKNRPWLAFVKRAFVGTQDEGSFVKHAELEATRAGMESEETHDGEL